MRLKKCFLNTSVTTWVKHLFMLKSQNITQNITNITSK